MKTWGIIVAGLVLALLATGVAEAWYGHGHGGWYGPHPRTTFGFGFNFVVPVYPYPAYPAGYYAPVFVPPPVYVPQCTTYTTPGYYRQVPWYTGPGRLHDVSPGVGPARDHPGLPLGRIIHESDCEFSGWNGRLPGR